MSIKSDQWIQKMGAEATIITPFEPGQVKKGISFGVSSYGYDFRLSPHFKILKPKAGDILDPKNQVALQFDEVEATHIDIPPNSYVLGRSLEYFKIPRNILTLCFGKSTYARSGVAVNVTPFEPEWEGYATLAIYNYAPISARVYAHEGIAQLIFLEASEVCATSYADRQGKYQAQKEITGAKI